jgi:beta-glucosidase-like glycosyl hydrolase
MREIARLLLPSVHWDQALGFAPARPGVMRALTTGIVGFVIEGGTCEAVAELAADIRHHADEAPIIAIAPSTFASPSWSDRPLSVPPVGAIASLGDQLIIRRAANAVAREALLAGCNTILAPSCDVSRSPSADAFAGDASEVAAAGAEWIDAARSNGVLCIAGRFPGAGGVPEATTGVPIVHDTDDALYASDLVPFRAAIDAGVAGLLISDAAYAALDRTESPAPLSAPILMGLLRSQLGFDGLAVADAASLSARRTARTWTPDLVRAGIDLVLRPANLDVELRATMDAIHARRLDRERVHEAARRRRVCAEMAASPVTTRGSDEAAVWLDEVAERAVSVVHGRAVHLASPTEVAAIGVVSHNVSTLVAAFAAGIADAGGDSSRVRHATAASDAVDTTLVVIASFDDARLAPTLVAEHATTLCTEARRLGRGVVIVWCAHPASVPVLPAASLSLACWSPSATMVRAAGRWLVRRV